MYKELEDAVHSTGSLLFFLPPYSPQLNPIEVFFSLLKRWANKYRIAFPGQSNVFSLWGIQSNFNLCLPWSLSTPHETVVAGASMTTTTDFMAADRHFVGLDEITTGVWPTRVRPALDI
ncbi:hypothetical protein H257_09389 [Aphanomyces astaci]|uniref:Tc1-like transposase DDE domain-containing protein n=1 Tax=Aphanomyces astaci TaxID=112090 RepID=W4GDE1_APHAT|nr:hypothetical protein H257_09389 [Aphanomyces astaci]ETV76983.1 hypothetical protein H257_09389 [Aphanomyces astaci]|eukprot:XP_009833895.1 hypothetical protein H257_09389 [Aphanomyces astaci]